MREQCTASEDELYQDAQKTCERRCVLGGNCAQYSILTEATNLTSKAPPRERNVEMSTE